MTKKTWELYDPITILPDGGMPAMDGIIAYLDNPKKPQKLGIRLTGSSIGLGDHSGSVDGVDYFECPLNSGVFVTPDQIEARTLSRIEQLRLKRELAAGQLESSKSHVGGASGFVETSTMSLTSSGASSRTMIGGAPPMHPNHQAIAPQEKPQSISLKGLSPTALARLQQINPGYMDGSTPVSISVTPQVTVREEDEEENLVSSSSSSEEEEEYLQENRKHIGRLQQRKEEIQRRKMELQQKKSSTEDDADNDKGQEQNDQKVVHPLFRNKPQEETPSTDNQATQEKLAAKTAETPAEEAQPLSRLEQLKLKKRQMESAPAPSSTTTSTTQPSTISNLLSMAAAASPPRPGAGASSAASAGEQVPWPFPATSRDISNTSSLTEASETPNNTAAAAPPTTAVPKTLAPAPEAEPLRRLEQLKLKKRQLEEGGAAATTATTKPQTAAVPPPPPPQDKENQPLPQPTPKAQSIDRGAPLNGNGQQQPPTEITVQIMNSSTKRVKEVQAAISKDVNLFAAVYDNKSVKQANVRKWGTAFVQQVKDKKSEVRCRVSLLANPPNDQQVATTKTMDLSVDELQTTTTEQIYRSYKDHFYPGRSKIQMLLVCQPVPTGGEESKLVAEPEVKTSAPPPPPPPKQEKEEEHVLVPVDRSSITSIASTLKDIKHQLRIKIINERTRYFKDLLVETSQQINLYEAIYNNPAVKEAKVRKWNSSIVEQVRSGMAEIVVQICTIPNGKPEHLVKHGTLTIEQLKECSTTQLYTRYAMDHYDLDNDESLIQLVLKCQQNKTPVASNQASAKDQDQLKTPTKLADTLPPSTPISVIETPPVQSRPTHPRPSPTDASQSSLTSIEKKPTNSPYAKAAHAALPMHNTNTKFSDLLNPPAATPAQPVDIEMGQVVKPLPSPPKTDASVQTSTEITTPVRDNRHPTPQQQQLQPTTFTEKLQQVDVYWWLAIIFILAAAFFAALFLGPIS